MKNTHKRTEKKKIDRKLISNKINKILRSFILDKKSEKVDLEKILENSKEKIKKFKGKIPFENDYIFIHKKDEKKEKIELRYEVGNEEKDNSISYGVNINYQSNESEEKVEVDVKFKDESKNKGSYHVSIKEDKNDKKYFIDIRYQENKKEVNLSYIIPLQSYKEQLQEQRNDFTKLVDKSLHIFPESIMGGVLGFTYLGENYMARRADITGKEAFMVDVHEAIHTPDEYETRILTDWMLSRPKIKYKQ